jgi:hypothetical protein
LKMKTGYWFMVLLPVLEPSKKNFRNLEILRPVLKEFLKSLKTNRSWNRCKKLKKWKKMIMNVYHTMEEA